MNEEFMPAPNDDTQPAPDCSLLAPLEGESPPAYEAFLYYFEMPLPRSLKRAASELGASLNTFEDWSVKYRWRKRIQDYRAHLASRRAQADAGELHRQQIAAQISLRMLESSSVLLDQHLLRGGEKIPVPVILRMLQVSDDLSRPRRGQRGNVLASSSHESIKKQLLAVAEYVRKEREKEAAASSQIGNLEDQDSPPPAAPATPLDPNQSTTINN